MLVHACECQFSTLLEGCDLLVDSAIVKKSLPAHYNFQLFAYENSPLSSAPSLPSICIGYPVNLCNHDSCWLCTSLRIRELTKNYTRCPGLSCIIRRCHEPYTAVPRSCLTYYSSPQRRLIAQRPFPWFNINSCHSCPPLCSSVCSSNRLYPCLYLFHHSILTWNLPV